MKSRARATNWVPAGFAQRNRAPREVVEPSSQGENAEFSQSSYDLPFVLALWGAGPSAPPFRARPVPSMVCSASILRATALLAVAAVSSLLPARAQLGLDPGDVAVVGWQDAGEGASQFAVVFLADVGTGERVYFTDAGWTGSGFRNPNGPSDGDGEEELLLLEVLAPIAAGTIVRTTDVGASFAWVRGVAIPGTASGLFGDLVLGANGDQITAFQHDTATNPLNTPVQRALFALDDTGSFEPATNLATGSVPSGLSVGAHTAVTFFQSNAGQSSMSFNTGALALATKSEWLTAISNAANWSFGSGLALPSGSLNVHTCPAVLSQRTNQSVCPGDTATFSVQATGSATLSYQWRKNGTPLVDGGRVSGATTPNLVIGPVIVADAGAYDVVVSNSCGATTSTIGQLVIDPTDSDLDGTPNCLDGCPNDPAKIAPGQCGCGFSEGDSDLDGTADCNDGCPNDPLKIAPGQCGCGIVDTDTDLDGTADCHDGCPTDPAKIAPGQCGCGVADTDSDSDATANCLDGCPNDPAKIAPGVCGCGVADTDNDSDGIANCNDNCPDNPNPVQGDGDGDGIGNPCDNCPSTPNPLQTDCDGNGLGDVCQIAQGGLDCNFNGIPDACDIASGTSQDADQSGIPDECEVIGGTPYCFGDGITIPCPCNNPSSPAGTAGCRNSTGNGARLVGAGMTSLASDQLVLSVTGMSLGMMNSCLFFQGDQQINGGFGTSFNDGLVCAGGVIRRLAVRSIVAGAASYPASGEVAISVVGLVPAAGAARYYQVWYRNQTGPCGTRSNISNGVQVIWVP